MYIQTARYVIKNYLALLKGKKVAESVKYVSELEAVSDLQLSGKQEWTLKELRLTLLRGLQFVLGVVMDRLQSKTEEESAIDIMNHKLGNRLQQLAQLHAVIFTVNAFVGDIESEPRPSARPILEDLCKLFSIGQIQRLSEPIIEASFICPTKFSLLQQEKQRIFARLRPIVVGLTDSFAIPEKYIRSQLARGHPYNVPLPYSEFPRRCTQQRTQQRHSGIPKDLRQHRRDPRKTTPKIMINFNINSTFLIFNINHLINVIHRKLFRQLSNYLQSFVYFQQAFGNIISYENTFSQFEQFIDFNIHEVRN